MRFLPCLCLLALCGCVSISNQHEQSSAINRSSEAVFADASSLFKLQSPERVIARPPTPAWHLLQAAAERAGLKVQIDIAAPNPLVSQPDELLPRAPFAVLQMYEPWRSWLANNSPWHSHGEEYTWWRQVIAGICVVAGLSFTTDGRVLSVRRESGLSLSRFVRAGLVESHYDADWREATVAEAAADLQSLFPAWRFQLGADAPAYELSGPGGFDRPLARCAIDVADWQLAYLFAWWAGLSCTETSDGFEFLGGQGDWKSHTGIQPGAKLHVDGRTGEVLRPPK